MSRACSLVVPAACALAWGCAAQDPFLVERPLARTVQLPEDRREPPVSFSLPRAPRVARAQLENGMRAHAVERPGTSTVSLIYVTGAVRIGEDYAPTYVADALLAGARREDGRVLHPIALSGRTPSVWTAPSGTMIGLTCGPEQLDDAVELLASMVQRPLFDAGWLAPVRSRTELDLLGLRSRLMTWRMAREHEGATFELDVEAIAEQVIGLDHAALAQLHGRLFRPEDSALIVVGDVAARHAREATERHFGGWRATPAPAATAKSASAPPSEPTTRQGRRIAVSPGRGIPFVTLFQDAPDHASKDAVAFELLTQVLSSIGSSSMKATLRYRHGHAYAAGASTVTVPDSGRYLLLRAAVGSDTLAQDLGEMLRILARRRTDLLDVRALEGAKALYGSRLALALSSSTEIAMYLAGVELGSVPPLEVVGDELLAVTPEQLRQVAQRYLDPERATVFVVGDASGAVDALRELGEVSLE